MASSNAPAIMHQRPQFPQSGQMRAVPRAAEESQPSMMRRQRAYTFQRDVRNRPFVPWTSPTKRDRRSRLLLTDRSAPIVDLFHPESQRYVLNLPGLGFPVPNMSWTLMSDGVPQRRVHDIEMVKLARRIIGMQIPPQPSQEMPATQTAEWWHYPPVTGGQYRPRP